MHKKSISPIITTVLLVLIGIAAVTLIFSILRPMMMDQIHQTEKCYNSQNHLKIDKDSGYRCFNTSTNQVVLTVKRGLEKLDLYGFTIGLSGDHGTESLEIHAGVVDKVTMIDGNPTLKIPEKGERTTYKISTTLTDVNQVSISPIMGDGIKCRNSIDTSKIVSCTL